jgi:putative SOS response-associated peptidase YedK
MCFTIEIHLSRKAIENRFSVDTSALYDFDFNYFYRAYTNPFIPVIEGARPGEAELMQWGLIPSWAGDLRKAEQLRKGTYNARAETLHEKPSFREPLRKGRCLVLAHGFFEWQHVQETRIPWYIRLSDGSPFAFAGLCDTWTDPGTGEVLRTCTIVTTQANPLMEKIHNTKKRMPVILPREKEQEWIDAKTSPAEARQLLLPLNQELMHAYTIAPLISDRGADPQDPEIIAFFEYPAPGSLF